MSEPPRNIFLGARLGCELAMTCGIWLKAKFGQPEIALGIIPKAGSTQRLIHAVGFGGIVINNFPADQLVTEAIELFQNISEHSGLIVLLCKEAINTAYEKTLQEGFKFVRKSFNAIFWTEDRKEGMTVFVEKSPTKLSNI